MERYKLIFINLHFILMYLPLYFSIIISTFDVAVELDPSNIESRHPLIETLVDLYPSFLWTVTTLYAILLFSDLQLLQNML